MSKRQRKTPVIDGITYTNVRHVAQKRMMPLRWPDRCAAIFGNAERLWEVGLDCV